jgi:transcriptional regulator with XRE-family HTH domain
MSSEGLGKRIARARKKKGISQNRLGELVGFSKGYVSRLESEERGTKNPSAEMIGKVAEVLGVTTANLLDGLEPSAPERFVELDPRYPNLAEALRLCKDKWLSATSQAMAGQALHALTDRTVGQWIDEGNALDRQLRRGGELGRPVSDEDDAPPFGR